MNIVYFSPHFPENYVPFITELKKCGATILGIADVDYRELSPALKEGLSDYYRVADMENYVEVFRAIGYFIHRHGRIDHLDSLNEHWLITEARLRTDFNIPGLKSDSIGDMKFKSKMKERFIRAGVPVAKGQVIEDIETARRFIKKVKYPVIAKPDNGVGATATYKISSDEHLVDFFREKPDVPYIFEEFIHGNIESFDGLTDKNGKLIFHASNVFCEGIMNIVNEDKNVYYYTQRNIPKDITEAGKRILEEFGLKGRFFHFEFFRKENGELVALEVNMRPPGGFTTDMFNYASDINTYGLWARMVTEQSTNLSYNRPYHAAYIGRKSRFEYKYNLEDIGKHCSESLVFHHEISGVFSPALGNYGFIIRHKSLTQLKKYIDYILKTK